MWRDEVKQSAVGRVTFGVAYVPWARTIPDFGLNSELIRTFDRAEFRVPSRADLLVRHQVWEKPTIHPMSRRPGRGREGRPVDRDREGQSTLHHTETSHTRLHGDTAVRTFRLFPVPGRCNSPQTNWPRSV